MVRKTNHELQLEVQYLEAQLAAARSEREEAEKPSRWPSEPPEFTVIRFEHTFPHSERIYLYAAVRIGDSWYTTAQTNRMNHTSWDKLVEFIGDTAKCEIADSFYDVPELEVEENDEPSLVDYLSTFTRHGEYDFGHDYTHDSIEDGE